MSRMEMTTRSLRNHLAAGVAVATFLVAGVGGWAATTELSGAVIAPGMLVVDSNVKKVQHPTGGVVGELRVRDGDRVKSGDVLLRLDETVTRANLAIVTKNLDELAARQARDEAERDGEDKITFPPDLLERAETSPEVARLIAGEAKLFELRRSSREGQRAQLRERIAQLNQQIDGLIQQTRAKQTEIDLIQPELEGVRELWKKGLVQINRVTSLQRDAARLEGERGQLVAATAEARGKVVETELQILQIDQDMRSEVGRELAEIRGKTSEFVERKVAAEDQLRRVEIRAPQDGIVHQLSVHTVGGVITAQGEPIMLIVPEADALRVEAKIPPHDIDQLHVGQRAVLRFSSFNQRTTPELNGEVTLVSADVSQDQKTAATFYTVHIRIPPEEIRRLEGLRLVPGMPVEAFVQTTPRTVMSYLVRPLQDQLMRAFREK
ncbi:HlyD family type I secretion periplasmic adaptor subunit [Enterovirga aerilata]|uniref:Membrane fusion protein (MFP) family protein n=1 Tax=Enterovirga aerilata TaxID=2730920 RepID=A0A849HTU3_9HYPH|nr:HlyD family type I secretion periplasmic adaptor subunit [Enterovirga sp. DB1703]NNM70916.1 HlyD family type I secretion periplasmic adaptor subunit [Enterovirga sp. DB1703]